MKHRLEILLVFTLTLFIFQNIVHAQETGFATFNDKEAGFSVSYPETWIQNNIPASLPYARLSVVKDKDDEDYISFLVQVQVLDPNPSSDVAANDQQASNFLDLHLKDPKMFTQGLGDPTIIKKEKIRLASKNGIFLQVENTNPLLAYRTTNLIYATVDNAILYVVALHCRKVYFAQNKPIMEKVAASFSFSPAKSKATTERKSNVGNSSDAIKPSPKKKKVVRRKKS